MNKVELNKYIKSIIDQIPVVNSFYTDDVYETWNGEEVKYGSVCFCITSSSVGDNTTTWNGLIYYGDRLLEDKSNKDAVQTDAINVISAVMGAIVSDDDIVTINYPTQVELFEQKFADYLAGGYATIQIETDNSITKCGYGYVKEWEGVEDLPCEEAIRALENELEILRDGYSESLDNINKEYEERLNLINKEYVEQVINIERQYAELSEQQYEEYNRLISEEAEKCANSIEELHENYRVQLENKDAEIENIRSECESEKESLNEQINDLLSINDELRRRISELENQLNGN